jgi:formate hydrogenlyase subunit 3/multisubunit Na+/H+ antiporter MnhD subunit
MPLLLALPLVPLAAGVFSLAARARRAMETANLIAFGITFVLSLALAGEVLGGGPVSMFSGFLYADHLSAPWCAS